MTPDATDQAAPRLSSAARWLFFAGGVAIPVALLLVAGEADRPSWQDGTLATYSTLVLRHLPRVFWGFFAYSVGSMVLLIATPEGLAQRGRPFAVRLGIYMGVLVSVQLVVQFTLTDEWEFRALSIVGNSIAILLWPTVPVARWLARWLGHDRYGPGLAGRIDNPLAADVAYLLLKPVEWTAYAALRLLVPDIDEAAARICPPMEDGEAAGATR
ncbi:MAG: hypothetical protein WD278_05730 [Pirellulales bacterium]